MAESTKYDEKVANGTLIVIGHGNGWTLWQYAAPTVQSVMEPGHFNEAYDLLKTGDHMHVRAPDGAAIMYVRSSSNEGVRLGRMALAEHPVLSVVK